MNSAHWIFKDALLDLGLVALALLASDRLQAMKNPVEYLATSDKTRFHRCIGAAILIITIHGIDAVAMLKDDGYIRWYDLLELVMQLVRTTYLLVCIYV